MPIVQTSVNRANRILENLLDKPFVARVLSPFQPIANTLTTRYLNYAIPGGSDGTAEPVAYTVIDAEGNTVWQGDTEQLNENQEYRRNEAR